MGFGNSFGKKNMKETILKVIIFAVAFGFVEAAVVSYLRRLLGVGFSPPQIGREEILFLAPGVAFLEPKTAVKVIADTAILNMERIREIATLVMLAAVGAITGKTRGGKIAFFFLAFGIWDIFYYLFLRLTIGWPKSFLDLDIFFLLPTPWVGPVLVPITVAFLLVVGSILYLIKVEKL